MKNNHPRSFPLGLLANGEQAEVFENNFLRSECMGIKKGKMIKILKNEGMDPILLKLDESRIAISRQIAMKIKVIIQGVNR
jgi:Fe2+ transport system protein FeoA